MTFYYKKETEKVNEWLDLVHFLLTQGVSNIKSDIVVPTGVMLKYCLELWPKVCS